jgi:hypothetical protein
MSEELRVLTLADYPQELREAYNDPNGDIMWRSGIARAAAILLKPSPDNALIDTLVDTLKGIYYADAGDSPQTTAAAKAALAEAKKWKGEI